MRVEVSGGKMGGRGGQGGKGGKGEGKRYGGGWE